MMEKQVLEHNIEELSTQYKGLEVELRKINDMLYNPDYIIHFFADKDYHTLHNFIRRLHSDILYKNKN